jgi:hypothetical protein
LSIIYFIIDKILNCNELGIKMSNYFENNEEETSFETTMSLREWEYLHSDHHSREHAIVNKHGINYIYLICKQCKSVLLLDTFYS